MAVNPNPDEIDLFDDDFYSNNPEYEVEVDPAMAAAMGFTSFGGTKPVDDGDDSRPNKKRRFNPHADDAVIGTSQPPVVSAYKVAAGRKGKAKAKAAPAKAKAAPAKPAAAPAPAKTRAAPKRKRKDEITYSDDDEDDDEEYTPARSEEEEGSDYEFEPEDDEELDSDAPYSPTEAPPATRALATGRKNAGSQAGSGRSTPAPAAKGTPAPAPATKGAAPAAPAAPAGNAKDGKDTKGGKDGKQKGQKGQRDPLWYVDYYDSTSNENPWEGMENHKGLKPVGTWLVKYWARAAAEGAAGAGARARSLPELGGAGAGAVAKVGAK